MSSWTRSLRLLDLGRALDLTRGCLGCLVPELVPPFYYDA